MRNQVQGRDFGKMAIFKYDDAIRRIAVGGKVAMEMVIWPSDTVILRV